MNIYTMRNIILIILISITVVSCKRDAVVDTPFATTPYSFQYSSHFPPPNLSADNPMTKEGVELGRKLYYDPILSNNGLSCSSCHQQGKGFTINGHPDLPVLPHVNLAWSNNFLWDGREHGPMESMMLFEVRDFFQTDLSKINNNQTYKDLFKKAFNVNNITHQDIAKGLSQFINSLHSGNSRFDRFLRHELVLDLSEMRGFIIFNTEKGDCFHCHTMPLMTDNFFHNTGLDVDLTGTNAGHYNYSGNPTDKGKFKTPTLRNVALRTEFMHDGRFKSLEEVIDHYDSGVKMNSENLDPIMTKPGKEYGLELSPLDKQDLVNFLKSLTDTTFITNPAFSKP
jgi:cytochrome c peroxidase